MEDLIARAKEMCDPPQPCIYDKLAWRKVVMALVGELEAARKDAALWQHWKPWLERRVGDLTHYKDVK
jgi:hypothetical protein